MTSCEGLAVDFVGNNLYWTDDIHRSIFAASLSNFSLMVILINGNLTHPKSIALDPHNGYVIFCVLFNVKVKKSDYHLI